MPKYIASGQLTLNGVEFTIEADSLEEARVKARKGDWVDWNLNGGEEGCNWKITGNVEEDEDCIDGH